MRRKAVWEGNIDAAEAGEKEGQTKEGFCGSFVPIARFRRGRLLHAAAVRGGDKEILSECGHGEVGRLDELHDGIHKHGVPDGGDEHAALHQRLHSTAGGALACACGRPAEAARREEPAQEYASDPGSGACRIRRARLEGVVPFKRAAQRPASEARRAEGRLDDKRRGVLSVGRQLPLEEPRLRHDPVAGRTCRDSGRHLRGGARRRGGRVEVFHADNDPESSAVPVHDHGAVLPQLV